MSEKVSNEDLMKVIHKLTKNVEGLGGSLNELTQATVSGFNSIEVRMTTKDDLELVEKRLGNKIDGIRNSLDAEIIRTTDKFSDHHARLTELEDFAGFETEAV